MKKALVAVLVGAGVGLAPPSTKAAIHATLGEYSGVDSAVGLTIEDNASGGLLFTLTLDKPSKGEITGFWADVNASSVQGWKAKAGAGTSIEKQEFKLGKVNNLGSGVNLNGPGGPGDMDFGIRFDDDGDDNSGKGRENGKNDKNGTDGKKQVQFVLTGPGVSLSAFEGAKYGARVEEMAKDGSAKLVGPANGPNPTTPVPDASSTVALLGLSLFGIEGLRRRLVRK